MLERQSRADLDAEVVVDFHIAVEAPRAEIEGLAGALVAFGQPDDARDALDRYTCEVTDPAYRAFADRLTRFIDSGASVPGPGEGY